LKKPDIPPNEANRLETLHALNILDTPPEPGFDRVTRLARRLFGVPIALVSLIDANRQWFKSAAGAELGETPRDLSFCAHAILNDAVMVVPDAQRDPRFADHPLVTGAPHIRFYAGCPLTMPNGARLGTLCLVAPAPRSFNADDEASLRDLAAIVEDELITRQLALQDELTKILNRRGFHEAAQQSLALCMRHGMPASLVFLDLDGFKAINDTWGHAEGDLALLTFSDQLQKSFRASDPFARIGGDEFAVLLVNVTAAQAEHIFARFKNELEKRTREAARGYEIRFSYGVVEYSPARHDSIDALLAQGDALMYAMKQSSGSTSGRP
jgi:diguanylate cyclase (GGDEF)-like protein